jgi:hypothetical protein
MIEPASIPQLVRKRQLAVLLSVSPRTIDTWVAKRIIPFIEPSSRLHLFDPVAVTAALAAQFSVPADSPLRRSAHDNA